MDFNENVISYNFEDKTLNINGARVTGVSSYSLKKSGENTYRATIYIDNAIIEYKDKSRFDGEYFSRDIENGRLRVSKSITHEELFGRSAE